MVPPATFRTALAFLIGMMLWPPMLNAQTQQPSHTAFQLAAGYYERGQWNEATDAFGAIIKNYPRTDEANTAHFFLGEALMQREEFENAYRSWTTYLERLPDGEFASRATFRMGEAAMRLKKFPQGIRLLETFVTQYPNDALMQFALAYLGEMRLTRGEPQLAQRVFEAALRIDPSGPMANQSRFGLARSMQVQGDTIDALNFYDFIVREPGNPLGGAARLEAGIIHFSEASYESATDLLKPIIDANNPFELTSNSETVSKAHYWLGRIALMSDDFRTALGHFREIDFDSVENDIAVAAWFDGAVGATRAGDYSQAEEWLTRLIDEHPDHQLTDDARFLQLRNASEQNLDSLVPTLADDFLLKHSESPFRNQVNELLGELAYQNEQYDETVKRFSELLETKPDPSDDHQNQRLTWSYYVALGKIGLEEFDQAETILDALASSDELPQGTDAQSLATLVQIALATTRFSQGTHDLAVSNYEAYLSAAGWNKETIASQHELLLCYAQTGKWTEARTTFNRLSSQDADADAGNHLQLIVSLAIESPDVSEPDFWLTSLKEAGINADDIEAPALAELAWLKQEQGDEEAANRLFDELLERFPNHAAAAKAGIARAAQHESTSDFKKAAAIYYQVAQNFSDQESGSIAELRCVYALHKINTPVSLLQAEAGIDGWIEKAKRKNASKKQQGLLAEALYQSAWIREDLNNASGRDLRFAELAKNHPTSKYWPDAAYRVAKKDVDNRKFRPATDLIEAIQKNEQTPASILARAEFLLGQANAKQERWKDAETLFGKLAQQTADSTLQNKSSYWLAESLYRQEKFTRAGEIFDRLQNKKAQELVSLRPWILLRSIQCLAKAENWQDANALAKNAIKEFPKFSLLHEYQFYVARGQEDNGLLNDAINGYQKVIDSSRGGSTETAAIAQWRIGEIRFHQQKYVAAIQAYHRVDSIFGYPRWRSASLLQAGKCQEHLKNWKHAEKLYRQLLKSFPDNELATDAQARLTRLQSVATKDTGDATNSNHTTR